MTEFDPNTFMQQNVDGPLETEYSMVPPGEYQATIDDFDEKAFETIDFTYKQGDRAGEPGQMFKFNIPFVIHDDNVKKAMERDKVVVSKQLILDMENGSLARGKNKNIQLGRIVAAAGLNAGNWSFGQLRGTGPFMVKVVHTPYKRSDGTPGTRVDIDRVVRIA